LRLTVALLYCAKLSAVCKPHVDLIGYGGLKKRENFLQQAAVYGVVGRFTGGNGDFVTLFEPTATEVAQAGKGYILASIGQESGEIPYTAYFASQAYISDHADIVQRFTNAIARAQKWIAEHDAAQTAEIIAPQFPDTSVPVLTQVVQRYKDIDAWNATPVMTRSSLERLETVMETAGVLDHADWVDFDRLVDNSYAHNAS